MLEKRARAAKLAQISPFERRTKRAQRRAERRAGSRLFGETACRHRRDEQQCIGETVGGEPACLAQRTPGDQQLRGHVAPLLEGIERIGNGLLRGADGAAAGIR